VTDTQEGSVLIMKAEDSTPAGSNAAFLEAKLTFKKDDHGQDICVVNSGAEEIGVMMGWERPISK
jgi:protein arginine N-methyltransferase 2